MRCAARCGLGGLRALGGGDAIGMRGEGPTKGCMWGGRARAERTRNMKLMSVTLEVSQLEMSALKFFKPLKR